jgi:hypothetical protein
VQKIDGCWWIEPLLRRCGGSIVTRVGLVATGVLFRSRWVVGGVRVWLVLSLVCCLFLWVSDYLVCVFMLMFLIKH